MFINWLEFRMYLRICVAGETVSMHIYAIYLSKNQNISSTVRKDALTEVNLSVFVVPIPQSLQDGMNPSSNTSKLPQTSWRRNHKPSVDASNPSVSLCDPRHTWRWGQGSATAMTPLPGLLVFYADSSWFVLTLVVCLGSLCCCRIHFGPVTCLYLSWLTHLFMTKSPTPFAEIHMYLHMLHCCLQTHVHVLLSSLLVIKPPAASARYFTFWLMCPEHLLPFLLHSKANNSNNWKTFRDYWDNNSLGELITMRKRWAHLQRSRNMFLIRHLFNSASSDHLWNNIMTPWGSVWIKSQCGENTSFWYLWHNLCDSGSCSGCQSDWFCCNIVELPEKSEGFVAFSGYVLPPLQLPDHYPYLVRSRLEQGPSNSQLKSLQTETCYIMKVAMLAWCCSCFIHMLHWLLTLRCGLLLFLPALLSHRPLSQIQHRSNSKLSKRSL